MKPPAEIIPPLPPSCNDEIMGLLVSRLHPRITPIQCLLLLVGSQIGAHFLTAAEPDLKVVFPSTCESGESVEITLVGSGLDQGGSIHFSRPGLSAEHIEKDRFRVTALADAKAGDCDLWVATPDGLAGPRRFSITPYPQVAEQESNDTREDAQEVSIPSVLDARLDKVADLDWFFFDGQKDQLISITCRSTSLDGSVQPAFTVFASSGRELVHSFPNELEPRRVCQLSANGTYRLLVHDRSYRRDDYSNYRLELTTSAVERAAVEHQASVIRADELFQGITVQDEQDQSRSAPQSIELPCRVRGRFAERNDVDWFHFQATKDQVVHIEAFGERLGQLMDLDIAIYNSEDKQVATIGDIAAPKGIPASLPLASLDPALAWKAQADGEYSLAVRDLYGGSVFGSDRQYELIVAAQQPSFFIVAMPAGTKPSRGVFVKQGGEAEVSLIVVRTGGFAGAVTIRAEEEIAGLAIEPCVLNGKEITKAIKLLAAKDAPAGFKSLRLVAEAEIDSDKLTMPVHPAVQIRSGTTRRIDEMIIYVSDR